MCHCVPATGGGSGCIEKTVWIMKRIMSFLAVALVAVCAFANYSYLNFVNTGNTGNSFAATGIKITFSGSNAVVSNGGVSTTVPLSGLRHMVFSNSKIDSALRGDVNGDGVVDVSDINVLINIILGVDDAANYGGRANVTGGESVDVSDINMVASIIIGM